MKKIILICLVALVGISAQAQKIAHVNIYELVGIMPEKIAADEKIKVEANAKAEDLKKTQDGIQAKLDAFKTKISKLSEAQQKAQADALNKEYQGLQEEAKKFEDTRADVAKLLEQKQTDTYAPIEKKVKEAIEKVAASKGFDYVIDSSTQVLVVAKGYNLLDDIKKEMGIK